jgi:hypothetical protein
MYNTSYVQSYDHGIMDGETFDKTRAKKVFLV